MPVRSGENPGDGAHAPWLLDRGGGRGRAARRRLSGEREADVARRRRRLHRDVDRLVREAAGARGAGRPARVRTGLRARAERPQRRLLQRDVVLAGLDARALGRRAGAGGGARRRAGGGADRRLLRGAGRRRLVPPGRLRAGLDRARPRRRLGAGGRRLPRARGAGDAAAAERGGGRRALPLAGLPRRRRLPRPRRPCSRRGWRSACASGCCAARGRDLRVLAGALVPRGRRRGRGAHRRRRRPRRAAACWRSAAPPRAGAGRCAAASPSPPRTSSSPSRCPTLLEQIGWTGGECITDARALLHYFRTTPDGRIAFGWGGGRIAIGRPDRAAAPRSTPTVVAADDRPPLRLLPRPRAAAASPTPGAARSTPRRPTCRWSRRCPAAAPSPPPATPATASAPRNMVGRTLASLALDRRDEPTRLAFVDA